MSDEFKEERWTYIGRRSGVSGKLLGVYLDPEGEEIAYALGKGVTHRSIGATYAVEVCREADGTRSRLVDSTFVEAGDPDDPRMREWEVRDRAAYTTDLTRKAEAKAKRDGGIAWESATLGEIRKHYMKLPWGQQTALIAQVIRYLQMSRV